jgi:hypothetical protein
MTPREDSEPQVRKTDIFREQALQAWRGQEAETRVLLDLSPPWMWWALGGIFVLATLGVFLAVTTSIPKRVTSSASARLSSGGDTVVVDAVFALPQNASIHTGQTMTFRPQDPGVRPLDLAILTVDPFRGNAVTHAAASAKTTTRVLVHAAAPSSRIRGDARSFTGPVASGTAHVLVGTETLLHLLRPRTPGGTKP